MIFKNKQLLRAAVTFCCSLFLFGCGSSDTPNTEEERQEFESVQDMLIQDSLKMDSLKKELFNK